MRKTVRASRTAVGRGRIRSEGMELDGVACKIIERERCKTILLVELTESYLPWMAGDRLRIGVNEFAPEEK
jgi:hypothetical protein